MKNFKVVFAAVLLVAGLGFTSCSSDDKYVTPEMQNPIEDVRPSNPIEGPDNLPE